MIKFPTPQTTGAIPRLNAIVDPSWAPGYWRVTVWNCDNDRDRMEYSIRADSEDAAAREGLGRFLAERATEESVDVGCVGAKPEHQA
jgi:hypothetical protein